MVVRAITEWDIIMRLETETSTPPHAWVDRINNDRRFPSQSALKPSRISTQPPEIMLQIPRMVPRMYRTFQPT